MKKIMFNDQYGLTALVLGGKKTMTRRVEGGIRVHGNPSNEIISGIVEMHKSMNACRSKISFGSDIEVEICTRFRVGERVAVAQSYKEILSCGNPLQEELEREIAEKTGMGHPGCMNKLFVDPKLMPHVIEITDFRLERLQSISDGDCIKEGVVEEVQRIGNMDIKRYHPSPAHVKAMRKVGWGIVRDTPRVAFEELIDCISGKGTWDKNPWVVVYEFKLV